MIEIFGLIPQSDKMCKYSFRDGSKCLEKPELGFDYCIIHLPFPENQQSEDYKKVKELKIKKIEEKIKLKDFLFEGAILDDLDITYTNSNYEALLNTFKRSYPNYTDNLESLDSDNPFKWIDNSSKKIVGSGLRIPNANFQDSKVHQISLKGLLIENIIFENSSIRFLDLRGSFIPKILIRDNTRIEEIILKISNVLLADIENSYIGLIEWNDAEIIKSSIYKSHINTVDFSQSIVKNLIIDESKFDRLLLKKTTISNFIVLNKTDLKSKFNINETNIKGKIILSKFEAIGGYSLNLDTIELFESKEVICRYLKKYYEQIGDKEQADDCHFYEMKVKTMQLSGRKRFFSKIFEYVFFYGVYPKEILGWWMLLNLVSFSSILIIVIFTGTDIIGINTDVFPNFPPLIDYLVFSFAYSLHFQYIPVLIKPNRIIEILGFIQILFGTILFTGFIASFIRKITR